jgi:hypothetical protein
LYHKRPPDAGRNIYTHRPIHLQGVINKNVKFAKGSRIFIFDNCLQGMPRKKNAKISALLIAACRFENDLHPGISVLLMGNMSAF